MPKAHASESVLHDWVHELPFQMQALLLTAMRGPDENNKYNAAKAIVRYLRGVVIKPAGEWASHGDPELIGKNNNDFMWGEYHNEYFGGSRKDGEYPFRYYAGLFWQDHDEYPHHFIMHLVHCAEVVGYKHPDTAIRMYWHEFYAEACSAFHMNQETEKEMDERLNDFGHGFHNRK